MAISWPACQLAEHAAEHLPLDTSTISLFNWISTGYYLLDIVHWNISCAINCYSSAIFRSLNKEHTRFMRHSRLSGTLEMLKERGILKDPG